MGSGFTVEAIVAQIRSRIAEQNARKPSDVSALSSMSDGLARDAATCRRRMEEDATRFAELDARIEDAGLSIGQQPLAPPTWRGRLGGWMVQGLRGLLWWYGLPVKEAVAQIGLRNREQAARHRRLQEDLLKLTESLQKAMSRIDGLEEIHRFDEALRSLEERIADAIGRAERLERITSGLNVQLQAEAQAREVIAGLVSRQTEGLRQVNSVLESLTNLPGREAISALYAELEDKCRKRLEQVTEKQQEELLALRESLERAVSRIGGLEHNRQLETGLERLGGRIAEAIGSVERGLQQVTSALSAQLQAETHTREGLADVVGRADRLERLAATLNVQLQAEGRAREALALVVNGQAGNHGEILGGPEPPVSLLSHASIDALYEQFEDTFRGKRELIKERQQVYLPCLREAQAGSISAPVLDLGCGRGEWLELLADHHLAAGGVDSNPGMVERCRALGIDVTLGDALNHLRGLADGSLGAVTSFHMVEHMPFEIVIALLDEALRVLRTGGVLILETPNPQNVLVGSNTFWLDPTHVKPIPSPTLRFFVEARGFRGVEIWNLQPNTAAVRLPEDPAGIGTRLNDYLYGPQDYGIIARRP